MAGVFLRIKGHAVWMSVVLQININVETCEHCTSVYCVDFDSHPLFSKAFVENTATRLKKKCATAHGTDVTRHKLDN